MQAFSRASSNESNIPRELEAKNGELGGRAETGVKIIVTLESAASSS